ncbi:hypothetical protein QFC22_000377 [Naganishia vaughanmartiniae]|uniref:Uncharacterized protein n=1 Tax=Naganishia vaughanmartiniae TaxID=1424756 RepID=A0ACC2XRT8_9TREE|nr:hypothetical protein QFC22_000377 [Naganishia vaughanmartiniae]
MTDTRSSDWEADTEDMDTAGDSQPFKSSEDTSSMPTTQASSAAAPMVIQEECKGSDEARAKTSTTPGKEKKQSEGTIDLEKLMNTIDMTRKVAMLQQRLTQASLLAQRSNSASSNQSHRTASPVSPSRAIQPSASSTSSNLRKRKSMASLSIVAPRGLVDTGATPHPQTATLPSSPTRPLISRYSPGAGPQSPSYTVLRSPSSSAAASMHVLTSIASRRRQSGTGPDSPCGNGNGGPEQAIGHGPRVAFAYPRSPGASSVQTVRSPGRGRYISSSGLPRFDTSGYSEAGAGKGEKNGIDEGSEMEVDDDSELQKSRKRGKIDGPTAAYSTLSRKSSVTLMPAFSSNTIYGVHHHNSIGSSVEPMYPYSTQRVAKKPRAVSHSVDSRPPTLRSTISGYKHAEAPGTHISSPLRITTASTVRSTSGARIDMPFGTDASDVDAANGLMSMLGSAPAAFNPARNTGPMAEVVRSPVYDYPSQPLDARMKLAKPRAASFASILTFSSESTHPTHRTTSPTRVRRLQNEKTRHLASPSSLKRATGQADFATPFSSDEEKQKASASASDEDQQAAEAILFLAASPSPAIAHSSPAVKVQSSAISTAETKVGRVLYDDTADETSSASTERSLRGLPSLSQTVMLHKRQSVGESPLHQPPINNTSPSRDRFSRALPPPLALAQKTASPTTQNESVTDVAIPPLTASSAGNADHSATSLSEPTELLSPPHSDHSKP